MNVYDQGPCRQVLKLSLPEGQGVEEGWGSDYARFIVSIKIIVKDVDYINNIDLSPAWHGFHPENPDRRPIQGYQLWRSALCRPGPDGDGGCGVARAM